ncbi:MAG: hypothetical protein AB7V19_05870 [Candidatus Bipolaricaulia bacterium]
MKENRKHSTGRVAVSGGIEATVKHNMARHHLAGARFLAERAVDIEATLLTAEAKDEADKSKQRTYVVGAVVLAVMGLEACINEVYLDAYDKNMQTLTGLDERETALLAEWWEEMEPRPLLLKYQHALLLVGRGAFPRGENPYQDTDSLVRLRNALTHYKPEWDDSLDVHADLQARLTGKFDLNPLATGSHLWFPHQCLGSGCAKWAVVTAEAVVTEFCARLGISKRI